MRILIEEEYRGDSDLSIYVPTTMTCTLCKTGMVVACAEDYNEFRTEHLHYQQADRIDGCGYTVGPREEWRCCECDKELTEKDELVIYEYQLYCGECMPLVADRKV